ncbi:MAG: FAD-binding protein [Desulfobacteraceae bacterium]|nr:FAD-binding protein [Desulfobacteraceae bacterium]
MSGSLPYSPVTAEVLASLRDAVGEKAVVLDPEKLKEFGKDAGSTVCAPEVLVEAVNEDQVQAVLRLANRYRVPVTPRGLGTGLAGGAVPVRGGFVLSLAGMNRIIEIDPENLLAVTEPGVVTADLKKAAKAKGLFYPPDPASLDTCSIGGNCATNAGGPSCIKYGVTRDYVLGLDAVLANGEKVRTGVQTRKGVVGYDLARLLVGSEGTLGIITRIYLKLIANPPAVTTMVVLFADLSAAMQAVSSVLAAGFCPCAMEFLDRHCLNLVGDLLPFEGVKESGAFLLVEVDGAPQVIDREMEGIGAICLEAGAINALLAPDSQKRSQMWEVRRQVSLRIEHASEIYIPEDVVVPIARIAEFVDSLPDLEERHGFRIYSFGHAGDGNIHLNISAQGRERMDRIEKGIEEVLGKVLLMSGTISGEHGIGVVKKRFLPMELSGEVIRIQKEIKRVFDPNMILNPDKLFL